MVTCEIKHWNNFKLILAAERVLRLFPNYFSDIEHVGKYSWAAISLWNIFEIIWGKFPHTDINYKGRLINKLQNGAIPLIFIIGKVRNIHFVGNLSLNRRGNFFGWWRHHYFSATVNNSGRFHYWAHIIWVSLVKPPMAVTKLLSMFL